MLHEADSWRGKFVHFGLLWCIYVVCQQDKFFEHEKGLCFMKNILFNTMWCFEAYNYWAHPPTNHWWISIQTKIYSWPWCNFVLDLEANENSCVCQWWWFSLACKSLVRWLVYLHKLWIYFHVCCFLNDYNGVYDNVVKKRSLALTQ